MYKTLLPGNNNPVSSQNGNIVHRLKQPIMQSVQFFQSSQYKKQFVFLVLPVLIAAVYLYGFSIEKYRSSATYLIRDNTSNEAFGFDLGIFGSKISPQKQDSGVLQKYLSSFDTLELVDREFQLLDLYHSDRTDMLDRLYFFSTREDFLELYNKNLSIVHDDVTGLTTLSFMDTDSTKAREMVIFLLKQGEIFLNNLNRKNAEKKIKFIEEQLEVNKLKLNAAIASLEEFQNSHKILDPKADMAVQHSIIANLEGMLVEKKAERNRLLNFMKGDSLDVVRLDNEIKEINSALEKARSKLSGKEKTRINDLLFQYEKLTADVDFASEVYKKTLVQYEVGRIEALQEAKILEVITTPTLPEMYAYPEKLKTLATLIIMLLVCYKIGQLILAVVQDHKD